MVRNSPRGAPPGSRSAAARRDDSDPEESGAESGAEREDMSDEDDLSDLEDSFIQAVSSALYVMQHIRRTVLID